MFSRIVGRQGQWKISVKAIQQLPQVFGSPADIVIRIIRIPHVETHRGLRHQLHQADRPGP